MDLAKPTRAHTAPSGSPVKAAPTEPVLLERGWLSANNIVFARGNTIDGQPLLGGVVVDTGYVAHAAQTLELLRQTCPWGVSAVFNTHLHSDHCGGNAAIQAHYGAMVFVPPGEADAARAWDPQRLSFDRTGQRCERFTVSATYTPVTELKFGDEAWQAIAAPGHDDSALMLWAPNSGRLISGDALWEQGFGVVFPEIDGQEGFGPALQVLDLIASLDPQEVYPGHGPRFAGEAVGRAITQARQRIESHAAAPESHARYGIKVLVAFHLLEKRTLSPQALKSFVETTPLIGQLNALSPQLPLNDLCRWIGEQLGRSGSAEWTEGTLIAR